MWLAQRSNDEKACFSSGRERTVMQLGQRYLLRARKDTYGRPKGYIWAPERIAPGRRKDSSVKAPESEGLA